MSPIFTSQRSTAPSLVASSTNLSPSSPTSTPSAPYSVSMAKRVAIAQLSPTAFFTAARVSSQKRARFSKLPPYLSVRLL